MTDEVDDAWMLSRRDADILEEILRNVGTVNSRSFEVRITCEAAVHALESILARTPFDFQVSLAWTEHYPPQNPDVEELEDYATVQISISNECVGLQADIWDDRMNPSGETCRVVELALTPDGAFDPEEVSAWLKAFKLRYGEPEVYLNLDGR
ncbi:hypothetical protein DQW77_09260 [Roseovarius sp. TE539]|uniref:hypothetical protein n=1 Tax=Roseovarius sp. TE539 TaxID=2249812 RepID=UPI000DE1945B|nr:hypothetical protein [Roseovarius sp. TE539]RBI73569.1 hypothetical protein DQW77_09260 [Roseovarius sp. TE539]